MMKSNIEIVSKCNIWVKMFLFSVLFIEIYAGFDSLKKGHNVKFSIESLVTIVGFFVTFLVFLLMLFHKIIINQDGLRYIIGIGKNSETVVGLNNFIPWGEVSISVYNFYLMPIIRIDGKKKPIIVNGLLNSNFKVAVKLIFKYGSDCFVNNDHKKELMKYLR